MEILDGLILAAAATGYLPWSSQEEIARTTGKSPREVEAQALALGCLPRRYRRNLAAISIEEQRRLFHARVAVIGCGGLGGHVIEELARLGVGSLRVWDYDDFEEHNLNRQLLAQVHLIGKSKVEAAGQRVKAINPVVDFQGYNTRFDDRAKQLLADQDVVVDALDNIPIRTWLARVCDQLDIPLVHGAVAGWYGQVCTQFPGENTLAILYGQTGEERGIENDQGVLVFAPALVASLQVAEVLKILLGRGDLLRRRVLMLDLLDMDLEVVELG